MHAKGRVHEEAIRLEKRKEKTRKEKKRKEKKRKEKNTLFGVNLMRSQVLYRAAQELDFEVFDCSAQCYADG